jgi:Asp-tRNA(Asn)/Glu-tRNA(Gln) amidotransferase A subunit family amidase
MPVGIKDIIETLEMPTQNGSPLYEGAHSGRDAATVWALREAGAVIVGKTVTTEFAATHPGATRNPHDATRTPGGSSSGSAAAVGSGMLPVALGTQVIGSILRPSSFCGAFGYKPTIGAINRGGSHDGLSQSAHGPIAASLEDAWITAREIADRVGGDPGYPGLYGPAQVPAPLRPVRLAVLETEGWEMASAEARSALEAALTRLKAAGIELATRRDDPAVEALERAIVQANKTSRMINGYESLWPIGTYVERDAGKVSAAMRERHAAALELSLADYRAGLIERDAARAALARLSPEFDACVTLSAPGAAPVGLGSTGNAVFNVPASFLGAPAITLPVLAAESLPLGFQMIGFHDHDAHLFARARAVLALLQ